MSAVFWKELSDHLGSRRFMLLFLLVVLASLWATYVAGRSIRANVAANPTEFVFLRLFTTQGDVLPSFITFLGFFGPLIGLALGFDAISGERSQRTLSRVLAQPIFRDAFINGKFLAGLTTVAVVWVAMLLLVGGMGIILLGFPPSPEEVFRLLAFALVGVVYVGFWLAVSMLFSLLFRRPVASALAGLGLWLLLTFFILMISGALADLLVPDQSTPALALRHTRIEQNILRVSPSYLFSEATTIVLTPMARTLGPVLVRQVQGLLPTPISLGQSLLLVWPHIITLLGLTAICFGIAYTRFMREEIRT